MANVNDSLRTEVMVMILHCQRTFKENTSNVAFCEGGCCEQTIGGFINSFRLVNETSGNLAYCDMDLQSLQNMPAAHISGSTSNGPKTSGSSKPNFTQSL